MTSVPDAWDDEWSASADQPAANLNEQQSGQEAKRLTTKQSKAQKRAQQAEFNRQLWAEASTPRQTNYFLESRNIVPLRQEYKAPPTLLSRKGPIVQKPRSTNTSSNPADGIAALSLKDNNESSEDEEAAPQLTLEEQRAIAAREREVKQRKYEERRLELFGPQSGTSANSNANLNANAGTGSRNRSGESSPAASLTPPGSRSATPSRGGRRGRRGNARNADTPRTHPSQQQQQYTTSQKDKDKERDLFDPAYVPRPESTFLMRREQGQGKGMGVEHNTPIREPRAPDGTAGFGARVQLGAR